MTGQHTDRTTTLRTRAGNSRRAATTPHRRRVAALGLAIGLMSLLALAQNPDNGSDRRAADSTDNTVSDLARRRRHIGSEPRRRLQPRASGTRHDP